MRLECRTARRCQHQKLTWCARLCLARQSNYGRFTSAGFFGGYVFDGSSWHDFDPDSGQIPAGAAPWLSIYVYDSDLATVWYEPAGFGSGTAYLGYTPRAYFDDELASAAADVTREAAGLASWLARSRAGLTRRNFRSWTAPFIADDIPEQLDDLDDDDAGFEDDADILVEIKVSRFLKAIGVPVLGLGRLPGA